MDAREAVAQMKAAHALSKLLCDAATHQTALSSKTAHTAQNDLIKTLDPAQQGKYTGAVNGQPAQKTQPGTKDLDPTQPVEKFATPLILMDSPTSINWVSPASTALFAGQHLHWTSQTDLHLAAAHTLAGVAGGATTLFTHSGGLQAIAANGPVSLQAHTDALDILADDSVTVTSVNGDIEVKANRKIVLQADGASITLEGPDITLACSGSTSVKGAVHGFEGAMRGEAGLEGLPSGAVSAANFATPGAPDLHEKIFDEQVQFINPKKTPLRQVSYTLRLADGSTHAGVTDDQGKTQRVITKTPQAITEATLQPRVLPSCCAVHAQNSTQASEPLVVKITDVTTNTQDVGSSVRQVSTPEGQSRGLTEGEIAMTRSIFKDSIDYTKVKIHNGEYLWFGMQPDNTAMTPDGEMYFNPTYFKEDFSLESNMHKHWFMHEMVHVWQYQLGHSVKWHGLILHPGSLWGLLGDPYEYELSSDKRLRDYNIEQQADIIADYYGITHGFERDALSRSTKRNIADIDRYKLTLSEFLAPQQNLWVN